jgi:hypothetical protein
MPIAMVLAEAELLLRVIVQGLYEYSLAMYVDSHSSAAKHWMKYMRVSRARDGKRNK